MKAKDILGFYEIYQHRYGEMVYLHLSEILADAKEQHQQDIDEFNAKVDEYNLKLAEVGHQKWKFRIFLSQLIVIVISRAIQLINHEQSRKLILMGCIYSQKNHLQKRKR